MKDLSRLGRNNAKTLLILDRFEESGVRVITADGRYDSRRDNELAGIETWYNERYIRDISQKTRSSIRAKQCSGKHLGNPPFGYRKNDEQYLVVEETEAIIVREIFKSFVNGTAAKSIAHNLNIRGFYPPGYRLHGNKWNAQTVLRILKNREYCGVTIAAKSEGVSFKNKRRIAIPPDKQIVTKNTHEGIVSEIDYEKVQSILKRNGKTRTHSCNLLANVIICGICNEPMYRRRVNGKWGYVCSTYTRWGKNRCRRHFCNEDDILERVKKGIIEEADGFKYEKTEGINVALNKMDDKLARAYMDFLDGRLPEGVYIKINNEISIERKRLESAKMTESNLPSYEQISSFIKNNIDRVIVDLAVEKIEVFTYEEFLANELQGLNVPGDVRDTVALISMK